jgi:glycosyltransferase involved in cell wall biosynthesis
VDTPTTNSKLHGKRISVVVPAYREALGIATTVAAIDLELRQLVDDYEIVIVDDGSPDATFEQVTQLAQHNRSVRGLRLSRNFGKEAALLAGLRAATGDAVITMDGDLQHPPSLIPEMVAAWCGGAQVVNGVKRDRRRENAFVRWRAHFFNSLFSALSGINVLNASDFKLLDRQAVDIIVDSFPEKIRFYRGLTEWIGFKQTNLSFDVDPRCAGESSFSLGSLISLSLTAILAFTSAPLRLVTVLGGLAMVLGAGVAADAIWSWTRGESVSGFVTLIVTMLFLGSTIMVSLGIIGEYVAKIYNEIKGRPGYLIAATVGQAERTTRVAARSEPPLRIHKEAGTRNP